MKNKLTISVLSILLLPILLFACGNNAAPLEKGQVQTEQGSQKDAHTFSNTDQIRTKHLNLEIDVDFDKKTIYGVARHQMQRLKDTDTAIFDINGLEIQKVTLGKKGEENDTDFIIGSEKEYLGQPLSVKIDKQTEWINIYYKTTENAGALDWLDPNLTAGKKHPYLYTQGEAVLTRTWIPVQGTPANKITYSADVKVPSDLMAVMSATNPTEKNNTGNYHFEMKQPIPVYLIALAVGNISYEKLGENCGVYTEPELLDKAAWELQDLPKMITAAENLYGKYQWEQYDVIILPYSFPFGGMENPRLTFANPTLIAGDRSAVSVIAHELAHSWSGNLVTNSSWNDFWLNEGFTVYFENRIMEALYGREVADMLALIEFQELEKELQELSKEDTHLKLQLNQRNPDDGMTSVAYVKGAFFLMTLERDFGRQRFDAFLKKYFHEFAFKAITTEQFKAYLEANLISKTNIHFNVDEWLYQPGLPKNCFSIKSPRFEKIQILAKDFINGKNIFAKQKTKKGKKAQPALSREQYTPQEWQVFIRSLPKQVLPERIADIDKNLHFSTWGNAEVATEWYVLCINSNYTANRHEIEKFVSLVGRRKFLLPIYTALNTNKESKEFGLELYSKYRKNYHPVSIQTLDNLLGYKKK